MKSYEVTLLDVLKTFKTYDFSGDSRTALMDVDGLCLFDYLFIFL